ncbi:hypothetical protein BH18ACT2_BH18ACT2_05770 [soil metagenome]
MAEVRRLIVPTAWCVLEVLVAADSATPHGCVETSVRSIAAELGVSKNTATRALTVLRRAGLLRTERQQRDGGRFGTGRYVLTAIRPTAPPIVDGTSPSSTVAIDGDRDHHAVAASTIAPQQLSMLDKS